ncbi:MAG: tetratricopeptide repeat protein [Planctomycetota bacterium]|nr:tetratricopeptide repeat protein [Planctomycetota bacterium]
MHRPAAEIFNEARELPPEQRATYLLGACGKDSALRSKVEELLTADAAAGQFLSAPTAERFPSPAVRPQPVAEQAGTQIGRYRLLEQIGEGGMGTIWMAEQREPVKRRVALKIIKLGMDTKQVIARFEAERQALAMMDHPNIAKVLDAGATETGRPYFVMEYIKGIPILEYCDQGKVDTRARLELFTKVCQAIQHAHQKGIIHRDIKPSNVLVTLHDGVPVPKVIDFGIAKATNSELTSKTLFTEHRQMIGTPAYMSPEQAEMSGLDIDTRSDIYSLGVLLYELLTGTTPFDIKTLLESGFGEMLRAIREDEPHKPSTRISSLGETGTRTALQRRIDAKRLSTLLRGDIDWIVMKCLEKDRTRRYETANGLAADIVRHLNDEPVTAGAPSAAYRLRKFVRRNRGQVLAGAAIVAALLAGVVAFAWKAEEASEQRDEALLAKESEAEQRREAELARAEAERQRTLAEQQEALAKRQETEALKQAAIAEAVAKFQTDMLAAVDPNQLPRDPVTKEPLKDKVTVVQAMEAAVAALDGGSLADQPLVEARVRDTIGGTLMQLGRFSDAEPNLRRALGLRLAAAQGDDKLVAEARDKLAMVLWQLSRNAESEEMMRAALETFRRVLPPGDPALADAMDNMAKPLVAQNRLAEAEPLLRDALALRRASLPPGDVAVAHGLNSLGHLLSLQDKYVEAEPLYREALAINRAARPAGHPELANSLNNLAACLKGQLEFDEAEKLFAESLAISRATLPAIHPRIALALNNRASLLQSQGRLAEAEPLFRESLDIWRAVIPEGHPHMVACMVSLAQVLAARGDSESAEALYLEALAISRRILANADPIQIQILGEFSALLQRRNRHREAEPLQRELVRLCRDHALDKNAEFAAWLNGLGLTELELGHFDEAEALLREALELQRATLPVGHDNIHNVLVNLTYALQRQGRSAEAERVCQEALLNRRAALPDGHPSLASALYDIATLQMQQGKLAEAEPLLREALQILRANSADGRAEPVVLASLANLLELRGRPAEAEPLYREWLATLPARADRADGSDARVLNDFSLLLWERGELAEAETLCRKALEVQRHAHLTEDPNHANVLGNLGALAIAQGRLEEAETVLAEALALKRRLFPPLDPSRLGTAADLANVHVALGKSDSAVALFLELAASYRAGLPPDSLELAAELTNLANVLLNLRAFDAAEPLVRDALATRERLQPDLWNTFNSRVQLGTILLHQSKLPEAEALLLSGYLGMKQRQPSIPPQGLIRLAEALERLITLAETQGDTSEAARWRSELEAFQAQLPRTDGGRR